MTPQTEYALYGGKVFFVENGQTIGGVTVSESAKPGTDPITNWPEITCVKATKFLTEKKNLGTIECFDGTNYSERPVEHSVRDEFMFDILEVNEFIHRLQFGLTAALVPGGDSVNAFTQADRKIWGWIKLQGHRIGVGTAAITMDVYGYFELEKPPEWKNQLGDLSLKFVRVPGSPLGTPMKYTAA